MLSGVVLARNEAPNLHTCLTSLNFCDELLVINDNSSDATVTHAEKFAARVITHPLNGDFAAQRNFGLDQARGDWVLFVDADEVVTPKLAQEIISAIATSSAPGFYLRRTDTLWGHRFKYGDVGGVRLLRLARKNAGRWEGKVHETWQIPEPTGVLSGELLHFPHPELASFLHALNNYSGFRATELHQRGVRSNLFQVIAYPVGKFVLLWVLKLGFLDGPHGFIHAGLMSFYSFLVRSKLFFLASPTP